MAGDTKSIPSILDGAEQMYIGQRAGKTVAMAWKCTGKEGERHNRETLREWIKAGYDIQTVHKDQCDPYYEELRAKFVTKDKPAGAA
jgi:hypothetical protein